MQKLLTRERCFYLPYDNPEAKGKRDRVESEIRRKLNFK